MQQTSRASTFRPLHRLAIGGVASIALGTLLSAAACQSDGPLNPEDVSVRMYGGGTAGGGSAGRVGSGGLSGSAGSAVTSGGSAGTTGSGSGGTSALGGGSGAGGGSFLGGSGGIGTGGSLGGLGGMSMAGMGATSVGGTSTTGGAGGSAGLSAGGMSGMTSAPCVDLEPPPDPDWPGATCENWALETMECEADWFKEYCDVSCKRCVPEGSGGAAGSGGTPAVDCSTMGLPNVSGGNGYATRYWDCCQTHCSQFDGHRCGQDGVSSTGNTQSSCSGGGSFACYDQSPRAVNDCLSYGYIAKSNPNCGGCYRIQFTGEGQYSATDAGSRAIKGKQMIVKVSNTGGDVANNQFDMMIPGGGVGQFNACSNQWGTSDLGAQYGGFLTECSGSLQAKKDCVRAECMKIPAGKARDGCIWFVDWFQVADNPKFTSQAENCPF